MPQLSLQLLPFHSVVLSLCSFTRLSNRGVTAVLCFDIICLLMMRDATSIDFPFR